MSNQAAASNGKAAVLVKAINNHIVVFRFAPRSIGTWDNRLEFFQLRDKAAIKLGYKKDRRCKTGWRKQGQIK